MTDEALISLITQLRTESEALGVRGVSLASVEQINWFRHTRDRLAESGAQFVAEKLTRLIDSMESTSSAGAGRLLDLLTTLRVFDRILTLQTAEACLTQLTARDAAGDAE